jgi:hypothetical protein
MIRLATALLIGSVIIVPARASEPSVPDAAPEQSACRVFITQEDPAARMYTLVRREVSATKKFYGSHDDSLMWQLADMAAEAGADAVIRFRETRQITMWSWASAKVTGSAVKWTAAGLGRVRSLKGNCWNVKTRKIQ